MNCVDCEENITNPVCPGCLCEGLACWVGEKVGPAGASAVFEVTSAINQPAGETTCIKCKNPMQVCAFCYTSELMDILKNHPAVLAQFAVQFDLETRAVRIPARMFV